MFFFALQIIEEGGEENQGESKKGKVVKFGWLDGVFVSYITQWTEFQNFVQKNCDIFIWKFEKVKYGSMQHKK